MVVDIVGCKPGGRPLRHSLLSIIALLLASCSGVDDERPPAMSLPPAPGVYAGTFPCHDCPGIDTTLWLRADGRFFLRQQYPAVEHREAIDAYGLGRWDTSAVDDALVLESEGPRRVFRREGADELLLQTDSALEHRLRRQPETTHFESTVRLTGTVRMTADGPVFTECLTGYAVTVREAGDLARFRHQYRSVRGRSGPVFVEFDGRFHWSNDGAPQSVTMVQFGTIRENGECHAGLPAGPD